MTMPPKIFTSQPPQGWDSGVWWPEEMNETDVAYHHDARAQKLVEALVAASDGIVLRSSNYDEMRPVLDGIRAALTEWEAA